MPDDLRIERIACAGLAKEAFETRNWPRVRAYPRSTLLRKRM